MSRRRNSPHDGYELTDTEPRFLVVRAMWAEELSREPIDVSDGLRAAVERVRAQMTAEGWQVEKLSTFGPDFFASRSGQRVFVRIGRAAGQEGYGNTGDLLKGWRNPHTPK